MCVNKTLCTAHEKGILEWVQDEKYLIIFLASSGF